MSAKTRIEKLNARLGALKQERQSFYSEWMELAKFINPRIARFYNSQVNQKQATTEILDSAATVALRTLGSGMMAGLTSPARPWFVLSTVDKITALTQAEKEWLYYVEQLIRSVFAKSNLYNTLPIAYASLGLFGTSAFSVLEDPDDIIRCYSFPVGSFSLAQNSRQRIDTIYREMKMTVGQLVDEFGIDKCSENVKNAFDNDNLENWVEVVHAIEPRKVFNRSKKNSKEMPFSSVWYEKANTSGDLLRESGFKTFPVMAARWSVNGEDIYGDSPGMVALPDVKQLQSMVKRSLQAIDKKVNPPMLADASLRTTRTSSLPGDVTYIANLSTSGGKGFTPAYDVNISINELEQKIQETRNRISRIFFEDMMAMFATGDTSQMTAREVEERHQEKLLVLGPVMERLNDEMLSPLITRTFEILQERGLIPEPPLSLQGAPLQVEYISVMAQAQKMVGTGAIERLSGFVGNLAGVRPDVLDKIDFDHMVDEYAGMLGASPKVITSDDVVKQVRQGRAQAAQAEKMAAMAQPLQQAAGAAKLLSETDINRASALQGLMGG